MTLSFVLFSVIYFGANPNPVKIPSSLGYQITDFERLWETLKPYWYRRDARRDRCFSQAQADVIRRRAEHDSSQ